MIGSLPLNGGTLPLANQAFGGGAGLTLHVSEETDTSLTVAYYYKNFPELSQPGDVPRVDGLFSATAAVYYALSPRLRPFASVTLNLNASTLDATTVTDMNYQQWVASLGLSWNALP